MNVYDFDETIYSGDSTRDFYFYSIKKHPSLLRFLPKQGFAFLKYMFGIINKTQFKEKFYMFLSGIDDIDKEVNLFWDKNISKIKKWYLEGKKDEDVIISASPEFLLKPVSEKLGFTLMASRVCKNSGKTDGENCWGDEKVLRFREVFPDAEVDEFYSDSLSDTPLALLAKKSFIVKENTLINWGEYKPSPGKRIMKKFLAKDFLAFLVVGCINTFNGVLFATLFSFCIENANISFSLGYACSLFIGFLLNCLLVFHQKSSFSKFIKYVISYIPNYLVQSICVAVLGHMLNLPNFFTYAISAIIGIPVTFLLLKIFAFKKNKSA